MADNEKKGFIAEFKEFINQGNAMDMAVGIIIGGAFTAIVTSLVGDIINPLIMFVTGGHGTDLSFLVVPGTDINFGKFIGAIINFLIIALVVFCMIKALNSFREKTRREELVEEAADPAPVCQFCLEEVKVGATRCPHCGGEFSEPAA